MNPDQVLRAQQLIDKIRNAHGYRYDVLNDRCTVSFSDGVELQHVCDQEACHHVKTAISDELVDLIKEALDELRALGIDTTELEFQNMPDDKRDA